MKISRVCFISCVVYVCDEGGSDVTDLCHKVVQLLLRLVVLLRHLLVLRLPVVALRLEGLYLALVVTCFDVCCAKPWLLLVFVVYS